MTYKWESQFMKIKNNHENNWLMKAECSINLLKFYFKSHKIQNSSLKNNNSVIYSLSCHAKPVWFLYSAKHKIFWSFFVHTVEVWVHCWFLFHLKDTFFKISSFVFHRKTTWEWINDYQWQTPFKFSWTWKSFRESVSYRIVGFNVVALE